MSDETNLDELIIKYLAGEASAEEAEEARAWISLSPQNEKTYFQYKKIIEASSQQSDDLSSIDVKEEWRRFLTDRRVKDTPVIPLNNARPAWIKIAAALIVIAATGFVIHWLISRNRDVVYQTQTESLAVVLPDGSRVTLNHHSLLSLSSGFGNESRKVSLKGEAFFDVAHDRIKPFIITTGDAKIEVVGTSFDIRSYENEKAVEVAVQTGIVKFSGTDKTQALRLTAGESGVYFKKSKTIETKVNPDPNFSSWNTQRLVFTDSDLKSVVETLNKTYHTNILISFATPVSCSITVSFDHQSPDAILRVLEKTLNLTIKRSANKIEITHAGC